MAARPSNFLSRLPGFISRVPWQAVGIFAGKYTQKVSERIRGVRR
jgi:hypothetical protein